MESVSVCIFFPLNNHLFYSCSHIKILSSIFHWSPSQCDCDRCLEFGVGAHSWVVRVVFYLGAGCGSGSPRHPSSISGAVIKKEINCYINSRVPLHPTTVVGVKTNCAYQRPCN